jgi:hypothetical protein
VTGPASPDGAGSRPGEPSPERGPTAMRGVWVAIVIVGGAAIVFLLLALTSGALNG